MAYLIKHMRVIYSLDERILYYIQRKVKCKALDFIFPKISVLGNGGLIWIFISIILMFNRDYQKSGLLILLGLSIGFILCNLCLKPLAARPRPCWNNKNVKLLIPVPSDYSFPSGHTISSVIASVILSVTVQFGYIAIPVAVLISFSRLYLYVHYPSDILASIISGMLISSFILHFICI